MNCRKARLYGADDPGEIPPGIRRGVEEHLERCPACREAAEQSRAVGALIALKQHEIPESEFMNGFLERYHRRLRMERTIRVRAPRRRWSWLWAEPAVVLRTAFATLLLTLAAGRIFTVGMRGRGGPALAQEPAALDVQSASLPWIGDSGAARASLGSGSIIIIRPESGRFSKSKRYIYERSPGVPVSYEF